MIRLDSSSRKLQFKTSVGVTTNELSIVVSYSDKTSTQYLGGVETTVSTGTTVVDICDAPPLIQGTVDTVTRDIDTIIIFNTDTTSKLIYVYYYDEATLFILASVTLSVGDQLTYVHGDGWKTLDSTGQLKTTASGGGGGITSINADATLVQTLTIGTAGTDFAIVDDLAGGHVFDLPTASAVNRGALSSADWTTFNNKLSSVVLTANQVGYGSAGNVLTSDATFTYNALTTQLALAGSGVGATGTFLINRGDAVNQYIVFNESAASPNSAFLTFKSTGGNAIAMGARFSAGAPLSYVFTDPSGSDLVTIDSTTGAMTLGIAGTRTGLLNMTGVTSGTVTIQTAAAAGTWTLTLPVDDGTPNQVLQTDGSGVTSWVSAATGTVTSVSGTVNRITSTGGATPVIDIDANYVGQASLTTLGIVTTGTWNADVISPVYGGTGVANNVASTLTISGAFATTLTVTGATGVTLPTSGTLYGTLANSISSAEMLSSMSDETGTGLLTFATSPTFTTDITTPLIIGGTAVGSNIIYKSTTGAGTTTGIAHQFTGGTNGATVISTQYNDGQFLVGTTTRIGGALGVARFGLGTATVDLGQSVAGFGAVWLSTGATPTATNFALRSDASTTTLNGVSLALASSGTTKWTMGSAGQLSTSFSTSSGVAFSIFTITAQQNNTVTASTEMIDFRLNLAATKQWSTGALTTQRDVVINPRTYAFVGASTVTTGATFAIAGAPIAGTNATITNAYALWVQAGKSLFAGNIELTQTVTTETVVSDTTMTLVVNGTSYKVLLKA